MLEAILMLLGIPSGPSHLQAYQGGFLLVSGPVAVPLPFNPKPDSPQPVRYRKGDTYAVWDKRGLTIRSKQWVFNTRLREVATSPKLFRPEEIRMILAREKSGKVTRDAATLAGTMRIAGEAYFLARWIDDKGFAWLEALVSVDLTKDRPKPTLLGRFPGLSLADKPLDDRLFGLNAKPMAIVRDGEFWGLASYDPKGKGTAFKRLGERLRAHATVGRENIVYVEAENYGPVSVGNAHLPSGVTRELFETRGSVRLLDTDSPMLAVVKSGAKSFVRNVESGSQYSLSDGQSVQRTALGILVWSPSDQRALLLDPRRWDLLARTSSAKPPSATNRNVKPASTRRATEPARPSGRRQAR